MNKARHTFYLTDEVWKALLKKSKETDGSAYGEQTRIVEEALREKLGLPAMEGEKK